MDEHDTVSRVTLRSNVPETKCPECGEFAMAEIQTPDGHTAYVCQACGQSESRYAHIEVRYTVTRLPIDTNLTHDQLMERLNRALLPWKSLPWR